MTISNYQYIQTRLCTYVFIPLLFTFANITLATGQEVGNQSMVIIKIPEMNDAQYTDILSGIAKDNQFTFEYACKQSNIIIVKYYHKHEEKADVGVATTSSFRKWAQISNLELIYMDLKHGLSSKC
ncbi:hypothetical protein QQ020_12805 [Fulvivirgaceae bacterium BMA12]|uniref:Uncharacterized protein n=1 Tax=Agaribacillus aureus TaxID=3051825 RepID=A0ABT8L5E3_9BACT|nr:hypothetical protein [Fulvivirgaceae bacterium BMA12]